MEITESVSFAFLSILTPVLLLIALGMFVWLTAKSRNIKSFQFQISLFIVIWIIGELMDLLEEGSIKLLSDSEIGVYVHILAMAMFSAMLWIRFHMSEKSGKKMVDTFQES
jgi:uncharacterized membrane protein SirB2